VGRIMAILANAVEDEDHGRTENHR
jgi:hypothetical protein